MQINRKKFTIMMIVVSLIFLFASSGFAAPQGIATLKDFAGETMIKNAGKWTPAQKDLRLYSGAKIVTREGNALVVFDDGATMFVDPFSSIRVIDKLKQVTPGSDKKTRLRSIRIMLGRSKYHEQPTADRKTRIELPTAVAALRGTGGWFGADEKGESAGKLYEGNMDTSGIFQEVIPLILELAQAMQSETFQASMASSSNPGDNTANINETKAELQAFIKNSDPEIKETVKTTLEKVETVLTALAVKQEKIEKAQQTKEKSEKAEKAATDDTVKETNKLAAEAADTLIKANKESVNSDIVLILETLQNDEEGIKAAQKASEQNDIALALADKANETAEKAADLVAVAKTAEQRETALASAKAATYTTAAAAKAIETNNSGTLLAAKDDTEGTKDAGELSSKVEKILATAEKSVELADKAVEASAEAETPEQIALAKSISDAAEDSSKAAQDAVKVSSLAAEAIVEQDQEKAEALTQTADEAAKSVEKVDEAVEEVNEVLEDENATADDVEAAAEEVEEAAEETEDTTGETIEQEEAEQKEEEQKEEEQKEEEQKEEEQQQDPEPEPEPEPEAPPSNDEKEGSPT